MLTGPLLPSRLHSLTIPINERRHMPSVSLALVVGGILGILQAVFLILAAKPALSLMGISNVSLIFPLLIFQQ